VANVRTLAEPPSGTETAWRRLSVLVVEDGGGDQHWIDEALQPACASGTVVVRTARGPDEAAAALKALPADCVMIDFDLAHAAGARCIEAIGAVGNDAAIVVTSRYEEGYYADYAFKFGAQDYIVKGEVDGEQLLHRLHYAAWRQRRAREGAASERLGAIATRDPLTGLPGRESFEDHARVAVAQARRLGTHLGVVRLGVDGIYAASDARDEATGRAILRDVTEIIREAVRDSDIVARIGGNEFALLLSTPDVSHDPILIAQRLVDRLGSVRRSGDHSVRFMCSAGVALYPEHGAAVETLMCNSEVAADEARRHGGGVWRYVPEFSQARTSRLIQTKIAEALEDDRFMLYFQPWFDVQQRAWAGVEVLLRCRDDQRLRSAAEFIAEAEQSGQVRDLGAIVLQRACEQWHRWRAAGLDVGTLALNVSDAELKDARHLANLLGNVAASGLPPSRLQLELRAAALTPGDDELARSISVLRENGFRVAADGVPAEAAALDTLTAMPLDAIKLERGVTRTLASEGNSGRAHRFVVAMHGAASQLDVEVVVTGVESESDCAIVMAAGGRRLQGRWLGEAASSAGIPKLWRRRLVLPQYSP
jgi:diguanylate cyclase (GGDEF)-like protein